MFYKSATLVKWEVYALLNGTHTVKHTQLMGYLNGCVSFRSTQLSSLQE